MKITTLAFEGNVGRQPQTESTPANFALVFLPVTPWPLHLPHRPAPETILIVSKTLGA